MTSELYSSKHPKNGTWAFPMDSPMTARYPGQASRLKRPFFPPFLSDCVAPEVSYQ